MSFASFGASNPEEYRLREDFLSEQPLSFDRSFADSNISRESSTPRSLSYSSSHFDEIPRLLYKNEYNRSYLTPSPTWTHQPQTVAEIAQDQRSTTLPSLKELSGFSAYLPATPYSDMSHLHDNDPYHSSPNEDKYHKPFPYEDGPYPYNTRYMHGEPNYYFPHYPAIGPPVTGISPHDIHNPAYSEGVAYVRPSLMTTHRRSQRGDPEYVKRPRRRAEEVERLYTCTWPGCDKAYGALNHLNTHVKNAEHGPKREPKEFAQVRREQKAKLARERQAKNDALYRHSGNEVFHYSRTTSTSYEYPHHRPLDARTYEARPLRDSPDSYFQDIRYHSPSSSFNKDRPRSSRGYDNPLDHPPEQPYPRSRWSPDSYSDLQARYPAFAKDLMSPHKRDGTGSPRELEPWPSDRHDTGQLSYMQGPNGSDIPRDHYYGRKEFS